MDLRFVGPNAAALADFDGDGHQDLAAPQVDEHAMAVAPGLPDGGFGPASPLGAPPLPFLAAAADLDGNGRPDLALLSVGCEEWDPAPCEGVVSVYRAAGGGLQSRTDYPVGVEPSSLVIADLNLDGLPDLVAGSSGTPDAVPGAVSVLLGRGQGAFAALPDAPAGARVADLAVGDVDGDGRPDLLAVGADRYFLGEPSELRLAAGRGDGTFGAWRVLASGDMLGSVDLADLDGDGDLDALLTDRTGNRPFGAGTLRVFMGDGAGGFFAVRPLGLEMPVIDATVADFDHDGLLDAALCAADTRETLLLGGTGDGRFVEREAAAFGILAVAERDLDGDQRADRIVAGTAGTFVLPAPPGLTVRVTLSFTSPLGRGSGTLAWTTGRETDLRGFNIVVLDAGGARLQINDVLIPCEECVTGLGASYTFLLPKHRGGREVYVEAVFRDGRAAIYGPARRE
jgi:hypothetical protein